MSEIEITADELVSALLNLASTEVVCLLDSCGVGEAGQNKIIAGIKPVSVIEISNDNPQNTLAVLSEKLSGDLAAIFTISYDFGLKMAGIKPQNNSRTFEPDFFAACFESLIIHDYQTQKTKIVGPSQKDISQKLLDSVGPFKTGSTDFAVKIKSNFLKSEYLDTIQEIQEQIRLGNTYQTNLTQQITAELENDLTPEAIFERLRLNNPAPFSAYIKRLDSTVVSSSPERFFSIDGEFRTITASPIKGTRARGSTESEDNKLRQELVASQKDRAENTMIVDLLRNDLGRVCEFGTVSVEKLCELAEHPTVFHLVSTIRGKLRPDATLINTLQALFPCGSITGAPKLSTMSIIDRMENVNRGLSMGAIGYYAPADLYQTTEMFDLSVAIRTMVIRDNIASFNVGGGIVIDSDPESEYDETLIKAKALLAAINADAAFIGY